jgi:hypothetical protein
MRKPKGQHHVIMRSSTSKQCANSREGYIQTGICRRTFKNPKPTRQRIHAKQTLTQTTPTGHNPAHSIFKHVKAASSAKQPPGSKLGQGS